MLDIPSRAHTPGSPRLPCEDEAVITCPKCFKENQDHYKFCLGCGAELPRDAAPKKFAAGTPPHGVPAVVPAGQRSTNIPEDATLQGGSGARGRAAGSSAPMAPVVSPAAAAPSPPGTPPP